jgi:hypothetical protein|tara:strand:- start:157 stop:363 length:207 start_codon:yes stop_codon:yes gene_type:complete
MKVFEANHAKGKYFSHARHAGTVCFLFIAAGLIGLSHVVVPSFLPEFMSRMNARIGLKLNQKFCECKD